MLLPERISPNIWCQLSMPPRQPEHRCQTGSERECQQFLHQQLAGLRPVPGLRHRLLQDDLVIRTKPNLAGLAGNPGDKLVRTGEFIIAERQ